MWNIRILILALFFCSFARGQYIIDSYRYASAPVPNLQNAADPINEVNGTANTDNNSQFIITSESSPTSQNGGFHLQFQQNAGIDTTCFAYITLVGVKNGDDCTVTFYAYELTGSAFAIQLHLDHGWVSTHNQNVVADGAWTQMTYNGVADQDDPLIRIQGTSSSDTGMQLLIDNIVVTIN